MRLYMPVEVFEETDAVQNHPEVFQRAGHHALIVTGRHSSRVNGSLQDVQDTLDSLGIQVTLFDSVRENPSVDSVLEAAKFGLTEGADFVIGIGGGSPMDAAKAVSLMMAHPTWDTSYLYQKNQDNSHLPLVLIPTTCGTGSEVTAVTILTRKSGDQWLKGSTPYRIFADAALVDGKYLASASMKVLRNTAVDALGHLWESALNRDASAYSRMLAEEGLRIWKKNKDLLLKKPEMLTEEERLSLMHASSLGGMSIAQTGTAIPHALSYTVTTDAGIPHGRAIGYFEAGYLSKAEAGERKHLLEAAGFSSLEDYENFYRDVCEMDELPAELLEKAVEAVWNNPDKIRKAPYDLDRQSLMEIAFWKMDR